MTFFSRVIIAYLTFISYRITSSLILEEKWISLVEFTKLWQGLSQLIPKWVSHSDIYHSDSFGWLACSDLHLICKNIFYFRLRILGALAKVFVLLGVKSIKNPILKTDWSNKNNSLSTFILIQSFEYPYCQFVSNNKCQMHGH